MEVLVSGVQRLLINYIRQRLDTPCHSVCLDYRQNRDFLEAAQRSINKVIQGLKLITYIENPKRSTYMAVCPVCACSAVKVQAYH